MTEHEERVFEQKAEKYFRSHRDAPNGRNFLAFQMRFHGGSVRDKYDMGICRTFPDAPGSRMCGACEVRGCDMRRPARLEDYQWIADKIQMECPEDTVTIELVDYDNSVRISMSHGNEEARKRWTFLAMSDEHPRKPNMLALGPDEQDWEIGKQVRAWKKFRGRVPNA